MAITGFVLGLLYAIIGVTDMILAGLFFGVPGVSAVSVGAPLSSWFSFLIMIFVNGCRIIYPEEIGRFDKESANQYFSTAMTVAIILSVVSMIIMLLVGNHYFDIFKLTGETLKLSVDYVKYYRFVYTLAPLTAFIGQMVYCDGDTKLCTISNIVFIIGNIVLSILGAIFIGMAGIGLATLVSGLISLLITGLHFLKKTCTLKYRPYFSLKRQIRLIRYSIGDATFSLFFAINGFIITYFITNRFGSDYLAVNSVVGQALGLTGLFSAIMEAMQVILNVYRGEGNRDRIRKVFGMSVRWTIVSGLILSAVVFLMSPLFPLIFSVKDSVLHQACITGIRIVSLTFVFNGIVSLLSTYYNASGYTIMSAVISRFKDSVLYVLLFVIFGALFGVTGLWIGSMLCPVAALLFTLILVRVRFGKNDPLLLNEEGKDVRTWDLKLSADSVMELRDQVKAYLSEKAVSQKTATRASLLIEEYYMTIIEKNKPGKRILSELSAFCGDNTELILKDDGEIFNLTDKDVKVTSLRGFVLSCVNEKVDMREHISTLSFNRSRYSFGNGIDDRCKNMSGSSGSRDQEG